MTTGAVDDGLHTKGLVAIVTGRGDGQGPRHNALRAFRECYPAMTAMNAHATITRDEFERTIEELRTEMKASPSSSTVTDGTSPEHPREEFVLKDEFRLFKWFAGLALAAVLSGMGLLYQSFHQGLAEQRESMERQFADLRAEMHAGFRAITASMDSRLDQVDSRLTAVQHDVAEVKERLAGVETVVGVKNRERLPD